MSLYPKTSSIGQIINMHYPDLTRTEQNVASYIRENQDKIIYQSITEVAEVTGTSEASVIRLCRKLGYKGFQEMKIHIAKYYVSPKDKIHENISPDDSVGGIIAKSFQSTIDTLNATLRIMDSSAFQQAAESVMSAGHIYVFGLGNSAPVARDIAHKFLRCGFVAHACDDNHFQMIICSTIRKGDVVIGVSHSGNSRDIVEALRCAKENGAQTICLTNYGKSPITKEDVSDIKLYTTSVETKFRVLGLTSRVAQLAIADAMFLYISMKKGEDVIKNFEKVDEFLTTKKY